MLTSYMLHACMLHMHTMRIYRAHGQILACCTYSTHTHYMIRIGAIYMQHICIWRTCMCATHIQDFCKGEGNGHGSLINSSSRKQCSSTRNRDIDHQVQI